MCRALAVFAVAGALVVATASIAIARPPLVSDAKDKQIVEGFCRHAAAMPRRLSADYCRTLAADNSEGYCWLICPQWSMLLTAYEMTGDAAYLDHFVAVWKNMQSALSKGPDGYLGWYGKALGIFRDPKDPGRKVDVVITSFRVVRTLCRFLELIAAEEPLAAKYAAARASVVPLMTDHLVKKWFARTCFVDLGATGMIVRSRAGLRDTKARLTHPHNKHSKVAQAMLALYRVTGRDEYMAAAVKLGTRFKRCLTLRDGHYEWNYWDPAGAWDVHPGKAGQWKHWIGREHRGGYYSLSLSQAVALYHHGVVFDRTDIDRFLKTQLAMCWNGDVAQPVWYRVDRSRGKQSGAYMCPALAPFDKRIAAYLYGPAQQAERLARMSHSWQGGPVASGYIHGKFLQMPKAAGGRAIYARFGRTFAAKAANRNLLESLRFRVAGRGYQAPSTPAALNPMPTE